MTFDTLQLLTLKWARDKNIIHYTNDQIKAQFGKTKEEILELEEALKELFAVTNDEDDSNIVQAEYNVDSELGDVLVTLIILAECLGTSLEVALNTAYNKIKNRTGKTISGVFVKDK